MATAELGLSKLDAVNDMMRAVGLRPADALDTNGASDEAYAEDVLDLATEYELSKGWPANTRYAQTLTAVDNSGSYYIDVGATVLSIDCLGPGRYRGNITLREGRAYINTEGTSDFGSAVSITANIIDELAWDKLPPDLKHVVLARAISMWKLRKMPDREMAAMFAAERAEVNAVARYPMVSRTGDPRHSGPIQFTGGGDNQQ